MTEISGGRWDTFLRRLFPVKGRSISPALAPELVPIVVAQPDGPELRALRNEKLFSVLVNQVSVGGQFQGALIRNPPDSTMLIVCTGIMVYTAGAVAVQLRNHGTTLHGAAATANVEGPSNLDGRFRGEGFTVEAYHVSDAVPGGQICASCYQGPGATWQGPSPFPPFIMDPGQIYGVWGAVLATSMYCSFYGFERIIEQAENF